MKKKILFLLFVPLLLLSCSNENDEIQYKRKIVSKIDMDLVDKLVGKWMGQDEGAHGEYIISEIEGYIYFREEKLQITDTIDDFIYTQTEEENPFYYDFKVTNNKLEVFPSYPVAKGTTGGNLAPMELIREATVMANISLLIGDWISETESESYYISISKNSEDSINYSDNLENRDSQILKIEEISENLISVLTEDKSSRYEFIFSESDKITAFMSVNSSYYSSKGEEIPTGISKPIKYKKIKK